MFDIWDTVVGLIIGYGSGAAVMYFSLRRFIGRSR